MVKVDVRVVLNTIVFINNLPLLCGGFLRRSNTIRYAMMHHETTITKDRLTARAVLLPQAEKVHQTNCNIEDKLLLFWSVELLLK